MQSKMGQWEGFVFDNNVWLVANWRQGILTIGTAPDSGVLHLTQGVLRVVGGSILDFLLFLCTYFCITFVSSCLS